MPFALIRKSQRLQKFQCCYYAINLSLRTWNLEFHVNLFFLHLSFAVPFTMIFLGDFYFADWQFFKVCGNRFSRRELTEISAGK